jgi:hypothetical protein
VRDVRPGPTKAELREQTAAAVASYAGPITRCAPKRLKPVERDRSAPMTAAVLTLMVLIVAFGAEVGWLVVDPPAS